MPDPDDIIAEIRSWEGSVDLFVAASASDAARARECARATESDNTGGETQDGTAGSGTAPRPDAVSFVIVLRGSGYIPHWAGGSWATAGENEEVFTLKRGQDLKTELKAYCERLVGEPEKMVNPPGTPGQVVRPVFWDEGPEIEVITEKIIDYWAAKEKAVRDTWVVDHDSNHGPLTELKKRYKKRGCRIRD